MQTLMHGGDYEPERWHLNQTNKQTNQKCGQGWPAAVIQGLWGAAEDPDYLFLKN